MATTLQHKLPRSRSEQFPSAPVEKLMPSSQAVVQNILRCADIKVDGARDWDIQVHDPRFFRRVLAQGSLGLGEAYMDGWWDCPAVDGFTFRVLRAAQLGHFPYVHIPFGSLIRSRLLNLQTMSRAFQVGQAHYDAGDDLYKLMLDKRMVYSCGYWPRAATLDEAQEAKLDLVCRKLGLAPGMTVLDIGCGWGSFLKYAAERYRIKGVGVTVSRNQFVRAAELCRGLPVDIRYQDYREIEGRFDRVVSIGMFEHVGYKNHRRYMRVVRKSLKEDGLFLLHSIANNTTMLHYEPWMDKYIFPNASLPSMQQIARAAEGIFVTEDCHNLSVDYDKTLMAWWENFEAAWPRLRSSYDHRFYRMWRYYLLTCAAAFRSRTKQVWQLVLSPHGLLGGYPSLR